METSIKFKFVFIHSTLQNKKCIHPYMKNKSKPSFINKLNPKNLDFIGSEFQLNYTANGRFQTKVGGVIWIGVVLCMAAVAYSSFKSLISTDSPVATVSNLYSRQAPTFDLYKEKIFFHLGFRNKGRIYPTIRGMSQINRFVTIKRFILRNKANPETGFRELDYVLDLNYKPCSQIKDPKAMEDFQWHEQSKKIAQNLGICPELDGVQDKYFINSKPQDLPNHKLVLYFFPCSLPNAADCAPLSEFQGTELLHSKTKKAFDITDYKNPLTGIIEFEGIHMLEPETSKNLFYKVRDHEVWDDTRDFFDKRLRSKSAGYFFDYRDTRRRDPNQLHCEANILNDPWQASCRPFLTLTLESSGEKQVIVRTYPKFFMILGEIEGTAEILVLFVVLIYYKYNNYYLKKYIKSEVYRINSTLGLHRIFPTTTQRAKNDKIVGTPIHPLDEDLHGDQRLGAPKIMIKSQMESPGDGRGGYNIHRNLNSHSKKSKNKRVDELLNQQINSNMSGISLFKNLNHLEILTKIFFKPRHRKMLPVVLLNLIDKENKNKQKAMRSTRGALAYAITKSEENMTLEQAFEQIRNKQPESEVERIMDEFIIKNSPDYFKQGKELKDPPPRQLAKQNQFSLIPRGLEIDKDPFTELDSPRLDYSNPDTPRAEFSEINSSKLSEKSFKSISVKPPKRISIMDQGHNKPGESGFKKQMSNQGTRNKMSLRSSQFKRGSKRSSPSIRRGVMMRRAKPFKKDSGGKNSNHRPG